MCFQTQYIDPILCVFHDYIPLLMVVATARFFQKLLEYDLIKIFKSSDNAFNYRILYEKIKAIYLKRKKMK